jgi:cell wall-associated NlpC family hydrolase
MNKRENPYRSWLLAGLASTLVCVAAQAEPASEAEKTWLKPDKHLQDSLQRSRIKPGETSRLGGTDWSHWENTVEDAQSLAEDILATDALPPAPCLSTTFDKVHNYSSEHTLQSVEWLSPTGDGPCQSTQAGLNLRDAHIGAKALKTHSLRQELLSEAQELIGTPYRNGGVNPGKGFDCSGFVYYAMQQVGVKTPRTAHDQYLSAKQLGRADLQPGDLVFFKTSRRSNRITHVGIYLGGDRFIHAPSHRKKVTISSLDERYWSKRFIAGGRMLPA